MPAKAGMKWQGHPGLAEYFSRAGLSFDDPRDDGGVTLVFDESCRVTVHPGLRDEVVFESRLAALPADARHADDVLEQAASLVTSRLASSSEAIVLTDDGNALMLQRRIPAVLDRQQVESALEEFVNSVADWRETLEAAT